MTTPDLRDMNEVCCPDCGRPLVVEVSEHDPNKAIFEGCRCGSKGFNVPNGIFFGLSRGPLFLYVPKSN
jgi:hypothetical protein